MIDNYLKKNNLTEAFNCYNVLKSLKDETVKSVIELGDLSSLIIFNSGCSLEIFKNGAYVVYDKAKTNGIINEYMNQSQNIAESYKEGLDYLKAKQENETQNVTTPVTKPANNQG